MFFYQMALPLSASSQNSTKMKNHSSLMYNLVYVVDSTNLKSEDKIVHFCYYFGPPPKKWLKFKNEFEKYLEDYKI